MKRKQWSLWRKNKRKCEIILIHYKKLFKIGGQFESTLRFFGSLEEIADCKHT